MTYRAFGDSITAGAGASSAAKNYVALLGADLGVTFDNGAVSTSMAMDQADAIYARSPQITAADKCIVALGTNDQAKYDVDPAKRGYFIDAMRAYGVWLGSNVKTANPGNGVTFTGSWTNSGLAWGTYGATAAGAKASFTVTGTSVSLGMIRQYGNPSQFSVRIDGVDRGTFSQDGDVRTILGRSYGPMCLVFAGLAAGAHTVEITAVSASNTYPVYFHWLSDNSLRAKVFFGNIPHAVAYTYGGSKANVDTYNTAIQALVVELCGYGLSASLVDECSALSAADMFDNVHPNDFGHVKLRNAYYAALTGSTPPLIMTEGKIYVGSDGKIYAGQPGVTVLLS